jgi:hypothetical protein
MRRILPEMNLKFAKNFTLVALSLAMLAGGVSLWLFPHNPPRASGSLHHEAYVWQRAWTVPVQEAVLNHGTNFSEVVVLAAEVSWRDSSPHITKVDLDYDTLRLTHVRIGLALRIGAYGGPFRSDDRVIQFLAELAKALIAEASANGIEPAELQLDFDCAASKLEGYRLWLGAIQQRTAPVPVTITALPSWLGAAAFRALAIESTNYVLQVHSLDRPRDSHQPFALCDPLAARRAVERAGKLGVPFRVALPTYGYLLAFDPDGRFIGLSAEGPAPDWPREAQTYEIRSDPLEMAGLVSFWRARRPAALRGVIWYRLPVSVDILNWRWPTLGAIVNSGSLRESLRIETRRVGTGLIDIDLVNDGTLDISSRLVVEARWLPADGVRLIAGDGLNGFTLGDAAGSTIQFENGSNYRFSAGETIPVGWLKFDRDCEVQIEIKRP